MVEGTGMRGSRMALAVVCLCALGSAPALGGDWVATKLHGKVFEFVDGEWQPLERGDIVPDSRPIRTENVGRQRHRAKVFQRCGSRLGHGYSLESSEVSASINRSRSSKLLYK